MKLNPYGFGTIRNCAGASDAAARFRWLLLVTMLALLPILAGNGYAQQYTNSDAIHKPDPGVLYYNGYYYGAATGDDAGPNTLVLHRSKHLADLLSSTDTKTIPITASGTFWAPELHLISGKTYLYYTDPSVGQTRVAYSDSADPFGTYTMSSNTLPGYDWTTYVRADGTVWGFSTQWGGTALNGGLMSDPLTLSSGQNKITDLTASWESTTIEGAQLFDHNGKIFLDYSTGPWNGDGYELGLLTFNGSTSDRLDDATKWTKSSGPVFQSGNGIVSVGHNSVVQSPDGTELWNVYHGRYHSTSDSDRVSRSQRIDWNQDGSPNFGTPSVEGALLSLPAGETGLPDRFLTAGTYDDTDSRIYYSTYGWSRSDTSAAYSGTRTVSTQNYSYAMVEFSGTNLSIYGPEGTNGAIIDVYVDGSYVQQINLYAATAVETALYYATGTLTNGQHTVLLLNQNRFNGVSGCNCFYFGVDKVVVDGTASNLISDPGFESDTQNVLGNGWYHYGIGTSGVDVNQGKARSGQNNGWTYTTSTSWTGIGQNFNVTPNTNYTLSAWFTCSQNFGKNAYLGVSDTSNANKTEINWGDSCSANQYQQYTLNFNSGSFSTMMLYFGFNNGQSNGSWILVDDVSITPQ